MKNVILTPNAQVISDGLAKRMFLFVLVGVFGFVAAVIVMLSSMHL